LGKTTVGGFKAIDHENVNRIATISAMALAHLNLIQLTQSQAQTDSLTGLFNNRYMEERIKGILEARIPLAMLVLDVDRFKNVNDQYGHQTGDLVLQGVAASFKKQLRPTDLVGRYGGEEFLIIMPNTDLEQALQYAEMLRQGVEECVIHSIQGPLSVTVSIGVAVSPDNGVDYMNLFKTADAAMYQAKQSGRNRVCHASADGKEMMAASR
jgi:diguanylate cyclase (GGDEF)-like protein